MYRLLSMTRRLATASLLVAFMAGCGGDAPETAPEASEPAAAPPAPPPADVITDVREITFDAALEVDLDAMEERESGLFVQITRPGSGPPASYGDELEIHYTVWLPNGAKIDSSHDRDEPLPMVLGSGTWIDGWVEGATGMRLGEVRRLVIPFDLAYGAEGHPAGIPPYAPLVYEMELVEHVPIGEG